MARAVAVLGFSLGLLAFAACSTGGGGRAGYLRDCRTGNPNDVMVPVGSWCVDKYKASVWSRPDGTGTQFFVNGSIKDKNFPAASSTPRNFNRDGSGAAVVYAASKPGVIPARGLTWYQATVACASSGKVLIPDSVWQLAAIGTVDPQNASGTGGMTGGSSQDSPAARCNIDSGGGADELGGDGTWLDPKKRVRPTGRAGTTAGGNNSCISRFGVEDMIGNVWEWTDANGIPAGVATVEAPREGKYGKNEDLTGGPFGTDGTWNVQGVVTGCEGLNKGPCNKNLEHSPAAALRGGRWNLGAAAGATALFLRHSGNYSSWSVGFRCARPR